MNITLEQVRNYLMTHYIISINEDTIITDRLIFKDCYDELIITSYKGHMSCSIPIEDDEFIFFKQVAERVKQDQEDNFIYNEIVGKYK